MKASEIRAMAREKLSGKWGTAALATLVYGLITFLISYILGSLKVNGILSMIISIVSAAITTPMTYGFLVTMFKLNDNEEISYIGFLNDGFSNFQKIWSVVFQMALRLIIPIVLIIVSAIIFSVTLVSGSGFLRVLGIVLYIAAFVYLFYKSLLYSLILFILKDNPDMGSKEIVEKSAELMQGHIGAYICLCLSFIGWGILAVLTFGIGAFWLIPYMQVSQINFYRNLAGTAPTQNFNETEQV